MKKNFDIAVIGSGPGGNTAALKAASLGKKVVVIERDEIGGVCLNTGCIPTKTILASISLYSKMMRADRFGIEAGTPQINWHKVLERKKQVVVKLRKGIESLFKKAGIEHIKGIGAIKGTGQVSVGSSEGPIEIECENIIIATGSEKQVLPGFEKAISSSEALELVSVPESMAIIGAGAVGIEFSRIFSILGTKISLYEMMPNILPGTDKDLSDIVFQSLRKNNVNIVTGKAVKPSDITEHLVLVTGRKFDKIQVNSKMETSDKNIYAVGDVTGIANYAHVASMQGIVAAENACGIFSEMDYSAVPSCIFSDPELASVGVTEEKAKGSGIPHKITKFAFAGLGKSSCEGEPNGFVKLIVHNDTDEVIGCHIIGAHASDLIGEAALAVKTKIKAKDIAKTIHSHPTLPEALWEAAMLSGGY
ncbi:MAG: FAD-dependent oxidoreductase [Candidatus Margulisiibacteriota bacterium]